MSKYQKCHWCKVKFNEEALNPVLIQKIDSEGKSVHIDILICDDCLDTVTTHKGMSMALNETGWIPDEGSEQ